MEVLRTRVSSHVMATWLEPIVCEDVSESKVTLSVPNTFFIVWIKDNYLKTLHESIKEVTGTSPEIVFQSREESESADTQDEQPKPSQSELVASMSITDEFALKRNLNPRYTFASFVVGGCNQFAHAAALSVTENLGRQLQPFVHLRGRGFGQDSSHEFHRLWCAVKGQVKKGLLCHL